MISLSSLFLLQRQKSKGDTLAIVEIVEGVTMKCLSCVYQNEEEKKESKFIEKIFSLTAQQKKEELKQT